MTNGIQFEEENFAQSARFEPRTSKFASFLINWGLVKDEKGANVFLIVISIIFFTTSIFLFLKNFGVFDKANTPPQEVSPVEPSF